MSADDALWDEIVAIWFPSPLNRRDKKRIGGLVRDFAGKKAGRAQLRKRKAAHEREWPGLGEATPESVLKHWDRFGRKPRNPLMGKPREGAG